MSHSEAKVFSVAVGRCSTRDILDDLGLLCSSFVDKMLEVCLFVSQFGYVGLNWVNKSDWPVGAELWDST